MDLEQRPEDVLPLVECGRHDRARTVVVGGAVVVVVELVGILVDYGAVLEEEADGGRVPARHGPVERGGAEGVAQLQQVSVQSAVPLEDGRDHAGVAVEGGVVERGPPAPIGLGRVGVAVEQELDDFHLYMSH